VYGCLAPRPMVREVHSSDSKRPSLYLSTSWLFGLHLFDLLKRPFVDYFSFEFYWSLSSCRSKTESERLWDWTGEILFQLGSLCRRFQLKMCRMMFKFKEEPTSRIRIIFWTLKNLIARSMIKMAFSKLYDYLVSRLQDLLLNSYLHQTERT